MRHIFNENIATHFVAFVQQKHKDGAEEECGSQAVFLYLPFSQQSSSTFGRLTLKNFWLPIAKLVGLGRCVCGGSLTPLPLPRSSL